MEVRKRRIAKNKRRVVFRLLFLIFLLLLISAGVVGGMLLLQRRSSNLVQLTDMPFTTEDQHVYTGTGFLYFKNNTLTYQDLYNDKKNDSAAVTVDSVQIAGSAGMQLVYNSAGIKIVGVPYSVEFAGTLISLKCGNTCFAVLREISENAEGIKVYDKQGAVQLELDYAGQIVLDYGFYTSTSEHLYVIALSLDSGTPQSTIMICDMAAMSTSGVMNVQNQLIEQMHFSSAGIYVVGTNQIIRYSQARGRESYRETVYGWHVLDFDATSGPTFLLKPRNAETLGTVKLLKLKDDDVAATTQRLLQLPAGTMDAFLMGGKLVAVTANGYIVYGLDGKLISQKVFPDAVEGAEKLDAAMLLLQRGIKYYTIKVT